MFRSELESTEWGGIVDHSIWLRLAKLKEGGRALGPEALESLAGYHAKYPKQKLSADERDAFPYWMESGFARDLEPWRAQIHTPRRRAALVEYVEVPSLGAVQSR